METEKLSIEAKIELLKVLSQMCFFKTQDDTKKLISKATDKAIEIIDSIKV